MTTEFHTGGAESITASVFRALAGLGHQVYWCAMYRPGPTGELLQAGGTPVASGFMHGRADWMGFLSVVSWLRARRPDVLWFIVQPATVFWVQLAARLSGAACIGAVHNTMVFDALPWFHPYRWLLRSIDRIVCVARGQRDALAQSARLDPARVCCIYNGIDRIHDGGASANDRLGELRLRARRVLGIPQDAVVAGSVARLYPVKGVDIFVRAARLCVDADQAMRFVVIGDGPEASALQRLVEELGLQQHLVLLGHRHDVRELLPAFDIGVLSSRSEALPMGVLEYMAAGLPVIASEVGSIAEVVVHGSTGLLVPREAPADLAAAILRLAQRPSDRLALGQAGSLRVRQHFSLSTTVRETEALCRTLQSRRRASRS
jgi:glycosyltransferase involved in cell wall biosynthesis